MDYTKECWYCHKQTMVAKGNYFQCTECGTTWNEMLTLGKSGKVLSPLSASSRAAKREARRAGQPIY